MIRINLVKKPSAVWDAICRVLRIFGKQNTKYETLLQKVKNGVASEATAFEAGQYIATLQDDFGIVINSIQEPSHANIARAIERTLAEMQEHGRIFEYHVEAGNMIDVMIFLSGSNPWTLRYNVIGIIQQNEHHKTMREM